MHHERDAGQVAKKPVELSSGTGTGTATLPLSATVPGDRVTPNRLLLAFLGAYVLDQNRYHVSARVIIDVMGYLGVNEGTTRTTLNRMVRTGLLDRSQNGRTASFGMTDRAEQILREGGTRVTSRSPFTHPDDEWTLLSYSIPETRRELRNKLRAQLLWAGFGRLRDGLWIAPGQVDAHEILSSIDADDATAVAFTGRPTGGVPPEQFVRAAWDLDSIKAHHMVFLKRWRPAGHPANPVASYTALIADWLELLRHDPGLPTQYLPPDWPAHESAAVYHDAADRLAPPAQDMLDRMIASGANRR